MRILCLSSDWLSQSSHFEGTDGLEVESDVDDEEMTSIIGVGGGGVRPTTCIGGGVERFLLWFSKMPSMSIFLIRFLTCWCHSSATYHANCWLN